jgi:hypothetical protein
LRRGRSRLRQIEKTHVRGWLLARNDAAAAAKRERLTARGPLRAFFGTLSEAIDLIGQYQDAGIDLLINGDRNDEEAVNSSPRMSCRTWPKGRPSPMIASHARRPPRSPL